MPETYRGITFNTVLNAVDDLGMDPTGSTPIDSQLHNNIQNDTLIDFPPGEYRLTGAVDDNLYSNLSNFGIRGAGLTETSFKLDSDYRKWLFKADSGSNNILVEGFDIDNTVSTNCNGTIVVRVDDGLEIHDIEWLGFTPNATQEVANLVPYVETVNGVGHVSNVRMAQGGVEGVYPNRTSGIFIGAAHLGYLYLDNIDIREHGSTAFSARGRPGVIQIENSYFENNDNSSIRLGANSHPSGVKNFARNCTVITDASLIQHLPPGTEYAQFDPIRVGGGVQDVFDVDFINCTIEVRSLPPGGNSRAAIVRPSFSENGGFSVKDCFIRVDVDTVPAIWADNTVNTTTPDFCNISNTTIVGDMVDSGKEGAVVLDDCDNSTIDNLCMYLPNLTTEGIAFIDSANCTLQNSNINVGSGQTYTTLGSSSVTPSNITTTNQCAQQAPSLPNELIIEGTGTSTNYQFTVDGDLQAVSGTFPDGSYESITGSSVNGFVTSVGSTDEFRFSGQVTNFTIVSGTTVDITLNGQTFTPETVVGQPTENVYYIDPLNGNDANDGLSTANAWASFNNIITGGSVTLTPGEVVEVRDTATLTPSSTLQFSNLISEVDKDITIRGYQADTPTIDMTGVTGDAFAFTNCEGNIVLDSFNINNADSAGVLVSSTSGTPTRNVTVSNVTIDNAGSDGVRFTGDVENSTLDTVTIQNSAAGFEINSPNNTLRACVANNNTNDGYSFNTTGSTVEDCLAYDNGNNGFSLSEGSTTGGTSALRCVAWDNGNDGFSTNNATVSCTVQNCTSYSNDRYGFLFSGATTPDHVATNCIAYQNVSSDTSSLFNVSSTTCTWTLGISDPQFVSVNDADSTFLTLSGGSPCIDAGTNIGEPYTGTAPDLGAYEGVGTPVVTAGSVDAAVTLDAPFFTTGQAGRITAVADLPEPVPTVIANAGAASSISNVSQNVETIYYVDGLGGSNNNDGTSTGAAFANLTPFTDGTINLGPGDRILISDSATLQPTATLDFTGISGTFDNHIIIENYDGESPVIDGGAHNDDVLDLTGSEYVTVRDIQISNAGASAIVSGDSCLYEGLTISTFGASSVGHGIEMNNVDANTVRDCVITGGSFPSTSNGIDVNGGSNHMFEGVTSHANANNGMNLFNTSSCVLTRCTAYDNGTNGEGTGFMVDGANTIKFCVAYDNTLGFSTDNATTSTNLYNNTAWSNDTHGFAFNSDVASNNLADSNTTAAYTGTATFTTNSWDIPITPTFVSTVEGAAGFLRLDTGSPGINAGTDIGLSYKGSAPDVGAYEFAEATTYYVGASGSNDNNGLSSGAPFADLSVFNAAGGSVNLTAGDTVTLLDSTISMSTALNLTNVTGTSGSKITFTNDTGASPVVDFAAASGGKAVNLTGAEHITFENITFKNADSTMFYSDSTTIIIDGCTIDGFGTVQSGRGIRFLGDAGTATNNVIKNGTGFGIQTATGTAVTVDNNTVSYIDGDGIEVSSVGTASVDGNNVYACTTAIEVLTAATVQRNKTSFCTDGLLVTDTSVCNVYNNTSWNNSGTGVEIGGAAHDVQNNVSVDNGTNIVDDTLPTDVNNTWNDAITTADFSSQTPEDSLFLRPSDGSALIDAGADVGLAFNGDAPDYGAVETNYPAEPTGGSSTLVVDDFETDRSSSYTNDTQYMIFDTTTVYEGSQSLRIDDTSLVTIGSTSGLPNYFAKGNEMVGYFRHSGTAEKIYIYFGFQDFNNHYVVKIEYDSSDIDLNREVGGSAAILDSAGTVTFNMDRWYECKITWDDGTLGGSDNDITVVITDTTDDTVMWTGTANDSNHAANDGIAFGAGGTNGTRSIWFDGFTIPGAGTPVGYAGTADSTVDVDSGADTPEPVAGDADAVEDITIGSETPQPVAGDVDAETDVDTPIPTVNAVAGSLDAIADIGTSSFFTVLIAGAVTASSDVQAPSYADIRAVAQDLEAMTDISTALTDSIVVTAGSSSAGSDTDGATANIAVFADTVDAETQVAGPVENVLIQAGYIAAQSNVVSPDTTVLVFAKEADGEFTLASPTELLTAYASTVDSTVDVDTLGYTVRVFASSITALTEANTSESIPEPVVQPIDITSEAVEGILTGITVISRPVTVRSFVPDTLTSTVRYLGGNIDAEADTQTGDSVDVTPTTVFLQGSIVMEITIEGQI